MSLFFGKAKSSGFKEGRSLEDSNKQLRAAGGFALRGVATRSGFFFRGGSRGALGFLCDLLGAASGPILRAGAGKSSGTGGSRDEGDEGNTEGFHGYDGFEFWR